MSNNSGETNNNNVPTTIKVKQEPTVNQMSAKDVEAEKQNIIKLKESQNQVIDWNQLENQEVARMAQYYLNLANPIYDVIEKKVVYKDMNGSEKSKIITERPLKGFEYYAVNGKTFQQWIHENIGTEYTLDTKNNQIIKNATAPAPAEVAAPSSNSKPQ